MADLYEVTDRETDEMDKWLPGRKCAACDGTGRIWYKPELQTTSISRNCRVCDGSGYVQPKAS